MTTRLFELEQKIGVSLPGDYTSFLEQQRAIDEVGLYVATNPEYWGVRTLFELGTGSKHHQLDEVYRLVGDVIPSFSLPIADDWAGNLYLLICSGAQVGSVVWWNHERDTNDFSVQVVANSFSAFVRNLAREAI